MKRFMFIIAIAFILTSCGASFEQVSAPIIAKYGQPFTRTVEEKNKYLPNEDMSTITWGYLSPKIIVIFSRNGNTWQSSIQNY